MKRTLSILSLLFAATPFIFGQASALKKPDDPEALRKEAVAFLRETTVDVNNLRTLENRISFSGELAGLMWFYDAKEAKSMYLAAFGDFKQLLMTYDIEMNRFIEEDGEEDTYFGRGGLFGDLNEKAKLMRRFQAALQVRQQMAMSLAEHDPELAFQFFADTFASISNPRLRQQVEAGDKHFESQLLLEIANTNAAKAAELAARSMEAGISYQHVELIRKVFEKDAEKGASLAATALSKIKSDKLGPDKFWVISSFLGLADDALEASKKDNKKKPLLSQAEIRELADHFAQAILNTDSEGPMGMQFIDEIEKYSPSRASQIRNRFRSSQGARGGSQRASANVYSNGGNNAAIMMANSNTMSERNRREREALERSEKEFESSIEKLADRELPREERARIAGQAKRIVMQSGSVDKKIVSLSALAATVARAGDKELASEIMKEARGLVNPMPKNYQDFLHSWMLAAGYAEAEPERAFPLLEETIMRANETLAAFIKVGEFIDVAGEIIDEGEVQVGSFGGGMIRGFTSELGMAEMTLRSLARADFKKTRDLTNRFDRTEVRILAKMLILRAVLGDKGDKDKKEAKALEELSLK